MFYQNWFSIWLFYDRFILLSANLSTKSLVCTSSTPSSASLGTSLVKRRTCLHPGSARTLSPLFRICTDVPLMTRLARVCLLTLLINNKITVHINKMFDKNSCTLTWLFAWQLLFAEQNRPCPQSMAEEQRVQKRYHPTSVGHGSRAPATECHTGYGHLRSACEQCHSGLVTVSHTCCENLGSLHSIALIWTFGGLFENLVSSFACVLPT